MNYFTLQKKKLNLTGDKYKLYDKDFCEIDEEEILFDMAETSKEHLLLTLVPDGILWTKEKSSIASNDTESRDSCLTFSSYTTSIDGTTKSSQVKDVKRIVEKCSTTVKHALETNTFLGFKEKKSLAGAIEDYVVNDLNDVTLGVVKSVCIQIVDEYPESFKAKFGDQELKGAAESLATKVYNKIHYNKKAKTENKYDDEESCGAPKPLDEYGCVAYLPNLTNENWESQEKQRQILMKEYESAIPLNEHIMKNMAETYCLQRKWIHKEKDVSKIFQNWPYFKFPEAIIAHANELLGKDTTRVWNESLNQLKKPINSLAKESEIIACNKYRKNNKNAAVPPELKCVRKRLKEAKEISDVLKNEDPFCNILFDFIVERMGGKENIKYIYNIIEEDVNDDDIFRKTEVCNPVIIIRGKNLHDSTNIYDVVIEKKHCIRVKSFLQGVLITFLSYYVFGYVYPSGIEGTLETIQRLFFKINPPKGSKRGGNRKALVQHPKVTKLINDISFHATEDGF